MMQPIDSAVRSAHLDAIKREYEAIYGSGLRRSRVARRASRSLILVVLGFALAAPGAWSWSVSRDVIVKVYDAIATVIGHESSSRTNQDRNGEALPEAGHAHSHEHDLFVSQIGGSDSLHLSRRTAGDGDDSPGGKYDNDDIDATRAALVSSEASVFAEGGHFVDNSQLGMGNVVQWHVAASRDDLAQNDQGGSAIGGIVGTAQAVVVSPVNRDTSNGEGAGGNGAGGSGAAEEGGNGNAAVTGSETGKPEKPNNSSANANANGNANGNPASESGNGNGNAGGNGNGAGSVDGNANGNANAAGNGNGNGKSKEKGNGNGDVGGGASGSANGNGKPKDGTADNGKSNGSSNGNAGSEGVSVPINEENSSGGAGQGESNGNANGQQAGDLSKPGKGQGESSKPNKKV